MAFVTIALPSRNRPSLLRETIASIREQSLQDFEVIISDNSEGDTTAQIMRELGDSRFRVFQHRPNLSMLDNWRFALTTGTAPLVAFIHDDDLWRPQHLQMLVEAFDRFPHSQFYSCATQHFGNSSELQMLTNYESASDLTLIPAAQVVPLWLRRSQAQCASVAFRRAALTPQILSCPECVTFCPDYFLFGKAAISGEWIYNPVPTALYREHDTSATLDITRHNLGGVQVAHVRRLLCAFALEKGAFDEGAILSAVERWPVLAKAALVLALAAGDAPRRLREVGDRILDENPDVIRAAGSSRHMKIARWIGRWYLRLADPLTRRRVGWKASGMEEVLTLR